MDSWDTYLTSDLESWDTIPTSDACATTQFSGAMDLSANADTYWSSFDLPLAPAAETEIQIANCVNPAYHLELPPLFPELPLEFQGRAERKVTDEPLKDRDTLSLQTPSVPDPFTFAQNEKEPAVDEFLTPWYEQLQIPGQPSESPFRFQKRKFEEFNTDTETPTHINPALLMKPSDNEVNLPVFPSTLRRSRLLVNGGPSDASDATPSTDLHPHKSSSAQSDLFQSTVLPTTFFPLPTPPSSDVSSPKSEASQPSTGRRGHQPGYNHVTGVLTLVGRYEPIELSDGEKTIYLCPHSLCQHLVWTTKNGYKYHLGHGCPQNPDNAPSDDKGKKPKANRFEKRCPFCTQTFKSANGYKLHVEKNGTTAGGRCKVTARGRQALRG